MFDMFKMLGKLNEAQEKMKEAKDKLAGITLQESELDGVVTVDISGNKKILKISTSPEFYEKYAIDDREAILAEAINNALDKAEAYSKDFIAREMKDLIPNIPGMDLSSFLG